MKKVLPRSLGPLVRGTASSPSFTSTAASGRSFLDFAWNARKDVLDVLAWQNDLTWVQRMYALSAFALEHWPREAPHWRVSGPLVLPSNMKSLDREVPGAFTVTTIPCCSYQAATRT